MSAIELFLTGKVPTVDSVSDTRSVFIPIYMWTTCMFKYSRHNACFIIIIKRAKLKKLWIFK